MFHNLRKKIKLLEIKMQDLLERKNLLEKSINKEESLSLSLDKKKSRYASLKIVLEKFNQTLELERVTQLIVEGTFNLFSGAGNILLYLANQENNSLDMVATKKVDKGLTIKEKHGDLFDEWILRHSQSLLVEDTSSDFRFEPNRVRNEISRKIGSVIISPLSTTYRFIGALRVESEQPAKFTNDDLRFLSTISALASISLENSILYENTEELAIRDGLTGLYLRRFMDERGTEDLKYAQKQKNNLSILMVDIDNFKIFNDNFGHRAGDIVLMHIADLLKGIFHGPGYVVSRFGGEEFLVLLSETKKAEAIKLANNLKKSISDGIIFVRRNPIKVTVSIGVATFPVDADSWSDLIRQADTAMYKAKQEGRDKVCSL